MWELRYDHVVALKLVARIVEEKHLIVDTNIARRSIYIWMLKRSLYLDAQMCSIRYSPALGARQKLEELDIG